jgi:glycerophosphoryl diester phosphodiesterase
MRLFDRAEDMVLPLIDWVYAWRPEAHPGLARLRNCRIVSHRGEHDNRRVFENTLAAFDAAAAAGVWGIEFDLRWTRDLVPVVIHDPDLQRVFGRSGRIAEHSLAELRRRCPLVPTLAEVVGRYGGKLHLMAEIKAEAWPDLPRQNQILGEALAALRPGRDYHLLSLLPEMFRRITFAPAAAFVPVARHDFHRLSRLAIREGYGGVAGHYVLAGRAAIERHHAAGQQVGTGYPCSRNCLMREVRRGVDWIFSNHAAELQRICARFEVES